MSDLCPALDVPAPRPTGDAVGAKVWLKKSAHRYHGGLAEIVGRDGIRYIVRRIGEYPGTGARQFKALRGEFELLDYMAEAVRRLA